MSVSRWALSLIGIAAIVGFWFLPNWHLYRSDKGVESHLLTKTPLNSTEQQVLDYLQSAGLKPEPTWRGDLEANQKYPPNTIPGKSVIRVLVGEFQLVFVTSVEAFYIFWSRSTPGGNRRSKNNRCALSHKHGQQLMREGMTIAR